MNGHHSGHDRSRAPAPRPRPDTADTADTEGGQRADTPDTPVKSTHGRVVAWAGFVFGSVTSIAANVLHAWLPADTMPPGWTPGLAPQVGAAIWPIGLLLSVEVLSRAQWRHGRWWRMARYGGAGTVALGSAIISYGHVRDVLLAWGYGPLGASVGPLTLDGLMVVSGFALLSMTTTDSTTTINPAINPTINTVIAANTDAAPEISTPGRTQPDLSAPHDATAPVATGDGQAVDTVPNAADTPTETEDSGSDTRRATARELHARGWSHGRIAAELAVSKRTVRRYLSTPTDTENHSTESVSGPGEPVAVSRGEIDTNHHRPLEGVLI
ncbi:helix-turn-helix domain-containing protein [Nocardia uniformis]|uniref:Helix-turn-helix domain-containing protein n=1 Tax=Nocardia uniformis TaxID=53432 RepID=A0A849CKV9_9NOCA|nr:helix-turn-helix domain-containing protein [Nocardia uniformis]NNH75861.1 helix-turn-helix domain-containing protein [Nocardia uniformis]